MTNCLDLAGRVAVVIGGTSGIGRALSVGLAHHGAHVIPTGRRVKEIDAVCVEIETIGRRTVRQPTDVTARASIEELKDAVLQTFGRIDILVNAAGNTFRQPTEEIPELRWTALMDTALTGMLRSAQVFYPELKASGRGSTINIASLSSFVAFHEL